MKISPGLRIEVERVLASTSLSTGLPSDVAALWRGELAIYDHKSEGAAKARLARSECDSEDAATIRTAQADALREWKREHTLPVPPSDMPGFVFNWIRRDPSRYAFTKTPALSRVSAAISESERGGAGASVHLST